MKPETSQLVIVSHVAHFVWQGGIWAYGPYAREIDIWCDLFAQVAIAAPAARTRPPDDAARIARDNVSVRPQVHAGGDSVREKIMLLAKLPLMTVRLATAVRSADAVHVRCPGNLGLLGILVAPLFSRRLVAKYAGQWSGYPGEARTYRLQRRLLRSWWWRGVVTVYGDWPDQPPKVVPFFTSVLDDDQVARARRSTKARLDRAGETSTQPEHALQRQANRKSGLASIEDGRSVSEAKRVRGGPPADEASTRPEHALQRQANRKSGLASMEDGRSVSEAKRVRGGPPADEASTRPRHQTSLKVQSGRERAPLRLLFVGRLSRAKNVDAVIDAVHQLDRRGIPVYATLVGDGPERGRLEDQARQLGVDNRVAFTGGIAFDDVLTAYEQHDVLVLISQTEGWPKAIAEAMAFGLVAIGSNRGLVPEMLGEGRGLVVEPGDAAGLTNAIAELAGDPERRLAMIQKAAAWGQRYSLQTLRTALGDLLADRWTLPRSAFRDHPTNS